MLAFIFWHWPEPGADVGEYEAKLATFHQGLARAKLPGFQESVSFRIDSCPWLGPERRGYEDWYRVADFGALEPLNEGAVAGEARPGHDQIAALMGGGAGALYGLHSGSADVADQPFATWITKPRGMAYANFYAMLQPCLEQPHSSLWRRQLVTGPAREFLLAADAPADVPDSLPTLSISRTPLWLPTRSLQ